MSIHVIHLLLRNAHEVLSLKYLQKVLPFEAMSLDSKQIDVLYIDIYLLDMFQKTLRQIMNGLIFGFQVNKPYQILKLASRGNGHFANHVLWKILLFLKNTPKIFLFFKNPRKNMLFLKNLLRIFYIPQKSFYEYVVSQKSS